MTPILAVEDSEYMAWWTKNGSVAVPAVEYKAWLAGKEAARKCDNCGETHTVYFDCPKRSK